jgi:hypothetical protein
VLASPVNPEADLKEPASRPATEAAGDMMRIVYRRLSLPTIVKNACKIMGFMRFGESREQASGWPVKDAKGREMLNHGLHGFHG